MDRTAALTLPADIAQLVLTKWLCLKSLVRLDSALCARWDRETNTAEVCKTITTISVSMYNPGRDFSTPNRIAIRFNGGDAIDCADPTLRAGSGCPLRWLLSCCFSGPLPQPTLLPTRKWCTNVKEVEFDTFLATGRTKTKMSDYLKRICRVCVNLTTLTIHWAMMTGYELADALASTTCLAHLTVNTGYFRTAPRGVVLSTLTTFKTSCNRVNDSLMTLFGQKCTNLVVLHVFLAANSTFISDSHAITDVGVRAVLQGCPLLRDTDVEYATGVGHELRVELARRRQFSELVRPADMYTEKWIDLNEALLLRILEVSPGLRKLQVHGNGITDTVVYACAQYCLQLEDIDWMAGDLTSVAAVALLFAALGSGLRCVRFSSCPVLDRDIALALAQHCPQLEEYHRPTIMSDTVMVAMAERCTHLKTVDLAHTVVGDVSVVALSTHCKKLTTLHLWGCVYVTVHGVQCLVENSTQLTRLTLPRALLGQYMVPEAFNAGYG
jgi:hypothetical protein